MRYCWQIEGIPSYCGCGRKNDVVHALSCKKGGYVSMRHNALRDGIANMMRDVCKDVVTEPSLLPTEPNSFSSSRTTSADGARLDISVRGFRSTFELPFLMLGCVTLMLRQMLLYPFQNYIKDKKKKNATYTKNVFKKLRKDHSHPWCLQQQEAQAQSFQRC